MRNLIIFSFFLVITLPEASVFPVLPIFPRVPSGPEKENKEYKNQDDVEESIVVQGKHF
jgi:hypothetical protein